MSNYYTPEELSRLGFKSVGNNVLVSKKASIYNCEKIELGNNVRIDDFCVLSGRIKIGNNVHIANFCFISGGDEGITLDDFSGLAYRVSVFTKSDDYSGETLTNPTIPEKYRFKTIKKSVYIGRHVIVGAGSIILPGANLREGTSVGALSLVTRPTEEWSVYFGIPAKKIKIRKKDLLKQEEDYLFENESKSTVKN